MLKVYDKCCNNCLMTTERIVPAKRAKQIIQYCINEGSRFICHKASINGKEIVCKSFFDKVGIKHDPLIRKCLQFGWIKIVPQKDETKLVPYRRTNEKS